jgi:hypothetical protein
MMIVKGLTKDMKKVLFIVLALALGLGLYWFVSGFPNVDLPVAVTFGNHVGNQVDNQATVSQKTHKISSPQVSQAAVTKAGVTVSELLRSKNLKVTFDSLAQDASTDAALARALILRRCAQPGFSPFEFAARSGIKGTMMQEQRQAALSALLDESPTRACREFDSKAISDQDVRAAFERAASAGSALAKLRLRHDDIAKSAQPHPAESTPLVGVEILLPDVPSDFEALQREFFTKDHSTFQEAARLVFANYKDQNIQFGNERFIGSATIGDAITLVACELGADCGPQSTMLREACVEKALCQFQTYAQYLEGFVYSAADMRKLNLVQDLLRQSLAAGRFEGIRFVPANGGLQQPGLNGLLLTRPKPNKSAG